MSALTQVFANGGLPHLKVLELTGEWSSPSWIPCHPYVFPRSWIRLGAAIRIEALYINLPMGPMAVEYGQALVDPGFCPFLRAARPFSLEPRRRLREERAAAAAERERVQRRVSTLEAQIQYLLAREGGSECKG